MARRNNNTATMTDVANHARVSQTTVSRVLNNHPGINDGTRKAVYKAIKDLSYKATPLNRRPSINGKNGSKLRFGLLMCPLEEQSNPFGLSFFSDITSGIEEEAKKNNADIMLISMKANSAHEEIEMEKITALSGIIILGYPSEELIKELKKKNVKFVILSADKTYPDCDIVRIDNIAAGIAAGEYFISQKKKRIGFIASKNDTERLSGLQVELLRNNLSIAEEDKKFVASTDISSFIECTHSWLKQGDLPDFILVSFYDAANAVKKILEMNKVKVPEDVTLFTFSHSDINEGIPSIQINPHLMGVKAADRLLELVKNPNDEPHQIVVPVKINDK